MRINLPLTASLFVLLYSPALSAQNTSRVSTDSLGTESNGASNKSSVSASARFVAFESFASNLTIGDTNGFSDIFVRNTVTGETSISSISSGGVQGNGNSHSPSISASGRFIAFTSSASNLVPNDINLSDDIFVHDRETGLTSRVSINTFGIEGGNHSDWPSISADGNIIAFESIATNLVAGDNNGYSDVFVHDRQTGITVRASVTSSGAEGNQLSNAPSISGDGHIVSFPSYASNLVATDTNGTQDVFVHDLQSGITSIGSTSSTGGPSNGPSGRASISFDGTFLTFSSGASNLVATDTNSSDDIFFKNLSTGQTSRVSVSSTGQQGNGDSRELPVISFDGRYISFESDAPNLVPNDTNSSRDVFIHDQITGVTSRASINNAQAGGDDRSTLPAISPDGRFVTFSSKATNLVSPDLNSSYDIFLRDCGGPQLSYSGTCPGVATFTISNATPGGTVAIVYGRDGFFRNARSRCFGVLLAISQPVLGSTTLSSPLGTATFNATLPPRVCGLSVQAVDLLTCKITGILVL